MSPTSTEEFVSVRPLPRVLALLSALVALSLTTASPASATGDDYPWRSDQTWGSDAHGFTKRQCVSFVAWRTAQRGHVLDNDRQGWGSAAQWDEAARRLQVGIGPRPVVGAVAHWNAGESSPTYSTSTARLVGRTTAGAAGHVAHVERVHADGSATVSHYNGDGRRSFSVARVRAPRYLYVGVARPR